MATAPDRFEILVLGSGAGGKLLAWHMGQSGRPTALVERQWIGGSCPNVNCMPSKNEIWSASVAHTARHAAEFGTEIGRIAIDMVTVRQRKRDMVDRQVAAHLQNYKDSGVELILGSGRFIAPRTLEVRLNDGGTRVLAGDQVFLNVGTHATVPDVPGLRAAEPVTNIEAVEFDHVPPHLIVLGGGYVGLELAQAYRRFGSRVTIIQQGPHLLSQEDPDVAEEMRRILGAEGIESVVAAQTLRVDGRSGKDVTLTVRTPAGTQQIEGSDLLVAVGRTPNTAGIGLDKAGVELDARGYIRVNERLETSAPDVWAIGECAGSPHFTHASVDDFQIIRDNLAGGKRTTRDRLIPYCIFTDPPLAHVGLSEADARRQGVTARVARLAMREVTRLQAMGERPGFMKALISGSDDRILGFTMIGPEAGEVMAAVQTAMLADLPYPKLRDAVLAHLTMAEGLGDLLSNVPPLRSAGSTHGSPSRETVTVAADEPIPNLPGKRLVSHIVDYPPGARSAPHRHAGSAFIYAYVLAGEIRSQVDGEPARVYRAGETWFESPGAHHRVSENASDTEPAQLLAVLIVDAAETQLVIPDPQ